MSRPVVLKGPDIRLYINNKLFKTVQSISYTVDYGEIEEYGIDCPFPQEIALTKVSVKGSISGIRIRNSGGLQAAEIRPLFTDYASAPYISIRIQDRSSQEDIIFIPNAKVVRETHSAVVKQSYKLNFDFSGQIPMFALDRSK